MDARPVWNRRALRLPWRQAIMKKKREGVMG